MNCEAMKAARATISKSKSLFLKLSGKSVCMCVCVCMYVCNTKIISENTIEEMVSHMLDIK